MKDLVKRVLGWISWKKVFLGMAAIGFMFAVIAIGSRIPKASERHSKYEQKTLPSLPLNFQAGTIHVFVEPDDHMQTIYRAVANAKHSIDIVMYEFDDQNLENLLAETAKRGVTIRILLNKNQAFSGKISPQQQAALDFFQSHGISAEFAPAYFTFTHQKTIVIDDQIALVMTMNLASKYYATSRDFGVALSDPTDISAIEKTFDADWNQKTIPSQNGDDLLWSPGAETAMLNIINGTQKTLDVYNEEMYDDTITDALIAAAKRGVEVRVTMTYSTGEKSVFNNLVQNRVQLKTYASSSKKLYIHAKMILADNDYAIVGSQNFSWTSLEKNRELGIFITDPNSISVLEKTFQEDFDAARVYEMKK
jgi:phosphatidylserine/phosphatidylglycerophosphate/cardiolipin synthase-like enzyme